MKEFIYFLWTLLLIVEVRGNPWDWQHKSNIQKFNRLETLLRDLKKQPYFLKVDYAVKVKRGETAYLPCRVKTIGDYLVTWLKGDDVTVLSVGSNTFTSDSRYSVVHVPRPRIDADDWNLLINRTLASDAGQYFCSVNTEPKLSHMVLLTVEEVGEEREVLQADSPDAESNPSTPLAQVSGSPSMYAVTGDNVQLDCRISGLTSPPLSLYWTKDGFIINARVRSGISLEVEKLAGVSRSTLYLAGASTRDSGEYACSSDVAPSATVYVHVAEGLKSSPLLGSLSSSSYIPVSPVYSLYAAPVCALFYMYSLAF